jgi:hypothetical protein
MLRALMFGVVFARIASPVAAIEIGEETRCAVIASADLRDREAQRGLLTTIVKVWQRLDGVHATNGEPRMMSPKMDKYPQDEDEGFVWFAWMVVDSCERHPARTLHDASVETDQEIYGEAVKSIRPSTPPRHPSAGNQFQK